MARRQHYDGKGGPRSKRRSRCRRRRPQLSLPAGSRNRNTRLDVSSGCRGRMVHAHAAAWKYLDRVSSLRRPVHDRAASRLASSLVWVETPEEAQRLAALDDDGFRAASSSGCRGFWEASARSARAPFSRCPGSRQKHSARARGAGRRGGHVIPPIGAQGLNLGLRDAAVLADGVAEAAATGRDGSPTVLDAYEARRRTDVASRVMTVDLLNRSLISGFCPSTSHAASACMP